MKLTAGLSPVLDIGLALLAALLVAFLLEVNPLRIFLPLTGMTDFSSSFSYLLIQESKNLLCRGTVGLGETASQARLAAAYDFKKGYT